MLYLAGELSGRHPWIDPSGREPLSLPWRSLTPDELRIAPLTLSENQHARFFLAPQEGAPVFLKKIFIQIRRHLACSLRSSAWSAAVITALEDFDGGPTSGFFSLRS